MSIDECRALLAEWLYGGRTPDLGRRTAQFLDGTESMAECTECGQAVRVQSGASVNDAAQLIERLRVVRRERR